MAQPTTRTRKNRKGAVPDPTRIGVMTPQEFETLASEALGGRGWQKTFAEGTGLSNSTITRYLQGVFPIPQYVAVICEMLITLRRNGLPVPDAFSADRKASSSPEQDDEDPPEE